MLFLFVIINLFSKRCHACLKLQNWVLAHTLAIYLYLLQFFFAPSLHTYRVLPYSMIENITYYATIVVLNTWPHLHCTSVSSHGKILPLWWKMATFSKSPRPPPPPPPPHKCLPGRQRLVQYVEYQECILYTCMNNQCGKHSKRWSTDLSHFMYM